jgi:predicted kinase
MKVLILKGLSGSGKSTFAKKLVSGDIRDMGDGWKRINKDDLRAMIDNGIWGKGREKFIIRSRNQLIIGALSDGYNVVVDDTNLNPEHEKSIRFMCGEFEKQTKVKVDVSVKFFDEPIEWCIANDLKRLNSVGEQVIRSQYKQWLMPTKGGETATYVPPADKPEAIICDIDGTLAHMVNRSPFDWNRVGEDVVDPVVAMLIDRLNDKYKIIMLSGRDGGCLPETEKWLNDNNIYYDKLFMRTAGDNRKDNIVKLEIFNEFVRDNYQIKFVLDDRNQVVDMWRNELGLKVLQVADGDF